MAVSLSSKFKVICGIYIIELNGIGKDGRYFRFIGWDFRYDVMIVVIILLYVIFGC